MRGAFYCRFRSKREKVRTDMSRYSQGRHVLTTSELRVLSLAADGFRPCDMADRMQVNVYQVKDHIYQVIVKLGVRSLREAVVLYYQRTPDRTGQTGGAERWTHA
jgi:DNA-binding CsgD family transcriptional regulator